MGEGSDILLGAERWGSPQGRALGDGDEDGALQGVSLQRSRPLGHVSLPSVHSFLIAPSHIFCEARKMTASRSYRSKGRQTEIIKYLNGDK